MMKGMQDSTIYQAAEWDVDGTDQAVCRVGCRMAPDRQDRMLARIHDGTRQVGCRMAEDAKTALGDHDQKSPGSSLVTCQKASAQETIQLQQGWSQSLAAPSGIGCSRPGQPHAHREEGMLTCR